LIELITTATSKDEAERNATVAVLPVGSFEQHGDYLPLATDTIVASVIAGELVREYPVMVLRRSPSRARRSMPVGEGQSASVPARCIRWSRT
jgi:hypothetical protein